MTCKTFTNRSANELHPSALLQLQEQHYIVRRLSLLSWFSLNFKPMCKPNRLYTDHQKPSQVSIKESSNFTDTSDALSKHPGLPPSWAPDRLHAAQASSSKPRKCSAAMPFPPPDHALSTTRRRGGGTSTRRHSGKRCPAAPSPAPGVWAQHVCAGEGSRARERGRGGARGGKRHRSRGDFLIYTFKSVTLAALRVLALWRQPSIRPCSLLSVSRTIAALIRRQQLALTSVLG